MDVIRQVDFFVGRMHLREMQETTAVNATEWIAAEEAKVRQNYTVKSATLYCDIRTATSDYLPVDEKQRAHPKDDHTPQRSQTHGIIVRYNSAFGASAIVQLAHIYIRVSCKI